ncbi:MAG: YceI family protein [Thermoleophilaceae bacterium]
MPIGPGTYVFGPDNGTLSVLTKKGGAAAKAGHDLEIEVTRWSATLELGDSPTASLSADSRSFRVVSGSGGVSPLGDEEKAAIPQTIDDEVLKGTEIEFQSSRVDVDARGHTVDVEGELELFGERRSVSFRLNIGFNGRMAGSAHVTQSEWGIEPYTALFGTLKVADEIEVAIRADTRSQKDG